MTFVFSVKNIGLVDYASGCGEQQRCAEQVLAGNLDGIVLLAEHTPVLTVGRLADMAEACEVEAWRREGVDVVETNRGGRVTYHGPGQLVIYPIVNLKRLGLELHPYIRSLEETGIDFLSSYGIEAHRDTEHTGVWVGDRKIAAIGIHVRRWIATHGMAMNINNPISIFERFVPCGIRDKGVVSLCELLGQAIDYPEAQKRMVESFARIFQGRIEFSED